MSTYIVLVLCNNEVHYTKLFTNLTDAEAKAVSLANEWHRQEGIDSFGLSKIRTVDEIQNYHNSDAYFKSEDSAHIVIEELIV